MKRRRLTILALGALCLVVASACQRSSAASGTTSTTASSTTTTTLPPATVALPSVTSTVPTTTSTTKPRPTSTLPSAAPTTTPQPAVPQLGSAGPEVAQLQQGLVALGYWLGTPDGHFGGTTQQAIWALQKAAGIPRTGKFDAATAAALAQGVKPTATTTSGHVIEVNLAKQLLLVVDNGTVTATLNTSTGGHYVFYEHGVREVAITPTGQFTTYREINGTDVSALGTLWRPKFFVGGIAIHGDGYVPATPVSHGCVRVSNSAINWIWANNVDPIGTEVLVY